MLPTVLTCFERGNTHPEEHEYPKHLHREPNQRPPHENQQHARPERQRAFPLVPAGEEHKRPLGPEEEGDADEEEDVAHGEQGAVEEQDQAEDEEEAAAAAEGDADFCWKRESLFVLLYIVKEPGCLLNSLLLGRTLRVGEPHCRHGGREVMRGGLREGALGGCLSLSRGFVVVRMSSFRDVSLHSWVVVLATLLRGGL